MPSPPEDGNNSRREQALRNKALADRRLPALWRRIRGSLWWRPAVTSILSVLAVAAAGQLGRLAPDAEVPEISASTINDLLSVIASSMLAVTVFAVSVLNNAVTAASEAASPRVVPMVIEDERAQNALASFVGAFIYSLVGLVGADIGYFDPLGRFLLFCFTLLVLVYLLRTLIIWIHHVTTLGRMGNVQERIFRLAQQALSAHAADPINGCAPCGENPLGHPVLAASCGYLEQIDHTALQKLAQEHELIISVPVRSGDFLHARSVVALLGGYVGKNPALIEGVQKAFAIGDRDATNDPRHALRILGEIASRALSPGINDPVTALEALDRLEAALVGYVMAETAGPNLRHGRVRQARITDRELVDVAFTMVGRDAAGSAEVAARLQEVLATIRAAARPGSPLAEAADAAARRGCALALAKLDHPADRARLQQAAGAAPT